MGSQDGGGGGGGGGGQEGGTSADAAKKDNLYENRPGSKKIIRVVTVMAYMVSVSFVAIVLSGYYIFLWQPPNPRLLHRDHLRSEPRLEYFVDKPPTELSLNESNDSIDIHEKINLFRKEILRNRGIDLFPRSNNQSTIFNETFTNNNSRIYNSTTFDPIIRNSINTSFVTHPSEDTRQIEDVYESFDAVTRRKFENLTLFMKTTMNSVPSSSSFTSTTRNTSSPSISMADTSKDKLYKMAVNDSTLRPIENINDTSIKRSNLSDQSDARSWESLENFPKIDANSTDETSNVRGTKTSRKIHSHVIQREDRQFQNERRRKATIVQPDNLGSNIPRGILSMMPFIMNDTRDLQKSEGNLSTHISTEFLQNSSTEDLESSVSPVIVEPEPFLPDQEHEGGTEERLTKDTNDFDFI